MEKNIRSYAGSFIVSYLGSLVVIFSIFMATMLVHYRHVDVDYLTYAALRMLAISLAPGVLGVIFYKHGNVTKFFIGAVLGPLAGALFIML